MMLNRRRFLAWLAAAGASAWLYDNRQKGVRASARVEAFLGQMNLRQKVGQLFMFSLSGADLTDEMGRLISDYHAGGMVLFSYNVRDPEQVANLTNAMQRAAMTSALPLPLFISADQEGGRVARLRGNGFSHFPNPMALGAADDLALTEAIGAAIGAEMLACGVNMNLAPVLDVNTLAQNPVINLRAFGADVERVSEHGAAFIKGLQGAGVVGTGKHFPGHGSTITDSHYDLPIVTLSAETIRAEMQPFDAAISAEVGAIMTAHVLYQALDEEHPATFSPLIMTDILRAEMGFEGVLISDALTMAAVSRARAEPIYVMRDALLAGVDMLAYGAVPGGAAPDLAGQQALYDLVFALVNSGLLPESRLDESVRRVLLLKERFGLLDWARIDSANVAANLRQNAPLELLQQTAERAIALLRDDKALLPFDPNRPLAVIYPAEFPETGRALLDFWPNGVDLPYSLDGAGAIARVLTNFIEPEHQILCMTYDTARYGGQVDLINALPLDRTMVVALSSPYDIARFPLVGSYMMSFGTSPAALAALRRVLLGEIVAGGVAPVNVMG